MKIYNCESIGEQISVYTHKSGLKVFVCKKPEFTSSYAVFGTKYGSIDTKFRVNNDEWIEVPEGIAHFLEHKLFESEELDAFARFSQTGASANAFTSFDRTCYLFSCSSRFYENFEILLDFVQHPYFTAETVKKEQGIIGQEINMYNDSPNWRVVFNLLSALYKKHPVRIDIAGTVESISKIDDKLLYNCYNTFYNLSNMFICVAGNVDEEKIFSMCDKLLKDSEKQKIERFMPEEQESVVTDYVELTLPVNMPIFAIGFKEKCASPQKTIKEKMLTEIVLSCVFGSDGKLFKELFDKQLINEAISSEYFIGYGYACVIIDGESKDPKAVQEIVYKHITNLLENGIDADTFTRAKRSVYAKAVSSFDSVENITMSMVEYAFCELEPFVDFRELQEITLDQVNDRLKEILSIENSAMSVVKNK